MESAIARVARAVEGERNNALNHEAHGLARLAAAGRLDWAECERALLAAAQAAGLPEREARRTLESARAAGFSAPNYEGARLPQVPAGARQAEEKGLAVDDEDYHRPPPAGSETMLYGLTGEVARAGAETSEANRYAIAAGYLSFLSGAAGRDVFLPLGNVKHHPRLFFLHVGRSGRGRKGEAVSLVRRLRERIEFFWRLESPIARDPFTGHEHHGGLSTREGLAFLIHDGYRHGKEEVPPVHDKRLWVIESEFANVLHQQRRDGNTLAAALRDAWDGLSIAPAVKTSRLWATDPHVAMTAAVTPSELRALLEEVAISNGFLNRFLVIWAERERLVPFPAPTPEEIVDDLARRTMEIIRFAKGEYPAAKDSRPMSLTPAARELYEVFYRSLARERDGERIAAILERRAPITLRIAMLFAITDLTHEIDERHLAAAIAWSQFHRDSVRFIFASASDEARVQETHEVAEKILAYLRERKRATRTELYRDCFAGHLSAGRIDDALDLLLAESPPAVEVTVGEKLPNGKRVRIYTLSKARALGAFGAFAHPERVSADTHPAAHRAHLAHLDGAHEAKCANAPNTLRSHDTAEAIAASPNAPDALNTHGFDSGLVTEFF